MSSQSFEKMQRPRFGVAGAAAMVAICVTALALTATGPTSPASDGAERVALPALNCEACGRAVAAEAVRPVGDEHLPGKAPRRCGRCGH